MEDVKDLWHVPEPEAEKYLGWWGWEKHLGAKDRYRLYFTRSLMTPEDEEDFALEYADVHSSGEFEDALEEAGDDRAARAMVRLEAELDSYPYRVDWDARTPEEMSLVGWKPI